MIMPPTTTPMMTIRIGSISDVKRVDRRLDFLVVEVGDLVEHLVERAGLLTDRHHLHDHRREHRVLLEPPESGSPRFTVAACRAPLPTRHSCPTSRHTMSSDSRIGTPERTSAESVRPKRASAVLRTSPPNTGMLQLDRVPPLAALLGGDPTPEAEHRRDLGAEDHVPELAHDVRDVDQDLRRRRQLAAELACRCS